MVAFAALVSHCSAKPHPVAFANWMSDDLDILWFDPAHPDREGAVLARVAPRMEREIDAEPARKRRVRAGVQRGRVLVIPGPVYLNDGICAENLVMSLSYELAITLPGKFVECRTRNPRVQPNSRRILAHTGASCLIDDAHLPARARRPPP